MTDGTEESGQELPPVEYAGHPQLGDLEGEFETGTPLPHDGTCLLTAGAANSGKSTFLRAFMHRIWTDERLNLVFRDADGEPLADPELQRWVFEFDRGDFPERTPVGKLQSFFIEFGQQSRSITLSFVDLSGEDYQRIVPESGSERVQAELTEEVEHILTSRSVRKLLVFVTDAKRGRTKKGAPASKEDLDQALYEDMMFFTILNRIHALGVRRIQLLFVASKWDTMVNRNEPPARFFRQRLPKTRATLKRFDNVKVQYLRFSVGEVKRSTLTGEERIARHDPVPVSRVVQWVHVHACGRKLKGYPKLQPSLWDRMKGWVS